MAPPPPISDPPKRLPTGAVPALPAAGDDSGTPTEQVPPLSVGGRLQPKNFPAWGKWIGAAIVAIATSLTAAWGIVEPSIEKYQDRAAARAAQADARAKQAKQAAEAGFQVTKDYVQALDHRIAVLEAAAKRAQPVRGTVRRPVPVIAPARPAPLPHDLNAAEAQIQKAAPPAQGPPPTKPADAGP